MFVEVQEGGREKRYACTCTVYKKEKESVRERQMYNAHVSLSLCLHVYSHNHCTLLKCDFSYVQVSDYEGQLDATREQLKSRVELSNEMKMLLDQRAARIRQLEATLSKKREELDVSMETVSELLNASRESEVRLI